MEFARWIGRMAAAGAALLAVVWLIEAMPEKEPPMVLGATTPAMCASEATLRHYRALTAGDHAAAARARVDRDRCAELAPRFRPHWDRDLAIQGLLAAAVAVVLLLLSALIPRGRQS